MGTLQFLHWGGQLQMKYPANIYNVSVRPGTYVENCEDWGNYDVFHLHPA